MRQSEHGLEPLPQRRHGSLHQLMTWPWTDNEWAIIYRINQPVHLPPYHLLNVCRWAFPTKISLTSPPRNRAASDRVNSCSCLIK